MAWYSAFTKTSSVSNAFTATTGRQTLFVCGGTTSAFTIIPGGQTFFASGGRIEAFAITTPNLVYPVTGGMYSAFVTTVPSAPSKLLEIKNGDFVLATNYASVTLADTTGTYNAQTNPTGYQPAGDPVDPNRPYRSDLKLWTIYRIKTSDNPNQIIFPTSQANQSDPDYTYSLETPTSGIYELIMVGAPVAEDYANWQQNNLVEYAQSQTDWFVNSTWLSIDAALDNCLINMRWAFLEGIMCGNCDTSYLEFYADYTAMYYAMQIQSDTAMELYTKLTNYCSKNSDCGCYNPYFC